MTFSGNFHSCKKKKTCWSTLKDHDGPDGNTVKKWEFLFLYKEKLLEFYLSIFLCNYPQLWVILLSDSLLRLFFDSSKHTNKPSARNHWFAPWHGTLYLISSYGLGGSSPSIPNQHTPAPNELWAVGYGLWAAPSLEKVQLEGGHDAGSSHC